MRPYEPLVAASDSLFLRYFAAFEGNFRTLMGETLTVPGRFHQRISSLRPPCGLGAIHAVGGGRKRLQPGRRYVSTAPVAYPVGPLGNLLQGSVDVGDRGGQGTRRGGGGEPLHCLGGAVADPLPERHRGPRPRGLGETIQLRL